MGTAAEFRFRLLKGLSALFWIWFAAGLVIQLIFHLPASWRFANGVFLLLYGMYAAVLFGLSAQEAGRWRLVLGVAGVGLLGFVAELVGSHSGLPFGRYSYTDVLGFAVFGVPLAVLFAWLGVTLNAALLAGSRRPLVRALQTGVWAVGLDLVLDPVAAVRGMWRWAPQSGAFYYGVPWQNFVAWFVLAGLFSLLLPQAPPLQRIRAVRLYQGMLLMFGLLALRAGMVALTVVSLVLMIAAEERGRV